MTEAEIKEIEERIAFQIHATGTLHLTEEEAKDLLATVKELRELLNHATEYMRHAPTCPYPLNSFSNGKIHCDCGFVELQKQIEEKVKP